MDELRNFFNEKESDNSSFEVFFEFSFTFNDNQSMDDITTETDDDSDNNSGEPIECQVQ